VDGAFVGRYDLDGNIIWIRSAGGGEAKDVTVDREGNVYVVGQFYEPVSFGAVVFTPIGILDAFVAKYNPHGQLLWARHLGGSGTDQPMGIAVDPQGVALVAGSFEDSIQIGNTNFLSRGSRDIFLAAYNSQGAFQWAQSGGGIFGDVPSHVIADGHGNFYISAQMQGSGRLGPVEWVDSHNRLVIGKVTSGGQWVWIRSDRASSGPFQHLLALDQAHNLYVGGEIGATATLGATNFVSAGNGDLFLARLPTTSPPLAISRFGNGLVVSWPTQALNFTLQTRPCLTPGASWEVTAQTPALEGNRWKVTVQPSNQHRLFRLQRP